jgi:hypothetical protein
MAKFDFISQRGDVLSLSANPDFILSHIDGQTTASASLSSTVIGGADGDTVTNMQADFRPIIFDLRIRDGVDVEEAKRRILRVIKLKQNGTIVWEQNGRTVEISGKVEKIDMPRWARGIVMQVEMHCEQPFWEDIKEVVEQISEAISLHYFTDDSTDMLYFTDDGIAFGEYDTTRAKDFFNGGDVSVGLEIDIIALSTVTNPIIYDANNNFFGIGYGNEDKKFVMKAGDKIVITTHRGKKRVTLNGVSIFNRIKPNSTWLQLATGDNRFAINSDDDALDNMAFSLIYKQRYI